MQAPMQNVAFMGIPDFFFSILYKFEYTASALTALKLHRKLLTFFINIQADPELLSIEGRSCSLAAT